MKHKLTSSEGVEEADALIAQWQRGELGRGEFVDSLREALCPETMPGRPQAGYTSGNQSDLKGERELPPGSNLESAENFAESLWFKVMSSPMPLYWTEAVRTRDQAFVALCADKLQERGHAHAANSLRKMMREGKIP